MTNTTQERKYTAQNISGKALKQAHSVSSLRCNNNNGDEQKSAATVL